VSADCSLYYSAFSPLLCAREIPARASGISILSSVLQHSAPLLSANFACRFLFHYFRSSYYVYSLFPIRIPHLALDMTDRAYFFIRVEIALSDEKSERKVAPLATRVKCAVQLSIFVLYYSSRVLFPPPPPPPAALSLSLHFSGRFVFRRFTRVFAWTFPHGFFDTSFLPVQILAAIFSASVGASSIFHFSVERVSSILALGSSDCRLSFLRFVSVPSSDLLLRDRHFHDRISARKSNCLPIFLTMERSNE